MTSILLYIILSFLLLYITTITIFIIGINSFKNDKKFSIIIISMCIISITSLIYITIDIIKFI
ncbi:hypothetical protein CPT_Madawaska_222 [Staphylococcus phage Madawaska]|nr:hypothetical protein CPT_Madawaska_222 [Staphylococcus phage Madawaska]